MCKQMCKTRCFGIPVLRAEKRQELFVLPVVELRLKRYSIVLFFLLDVFLILTPVMLHKRIGHIGLTF